MEPRQEQWLADMQEAMGYIEEDTAGHDYESFRRDRRAMQLVQWNVLVLPEASRRLAPDLKATEPDTNWRHVANLGNIMRHEYHKTQPTLLWGFCQDEKEPLKQTLQRMAKVLRAARQKSGRGRRPD